MRLTLLRCGMDLGHRPSRGAIVGLSPLHRRIEGGQAMTMNQPNQLPDLQRAVARSIRDHWGMFLAEGIILVILGMVAIVVPPLATIAVAIVVGWLFLISGVAGLIMTFMTRGAPGFWWSLLSAVIGIAAGLALLIRPVAGAFSL